MKPSLEVCLRIEDETLRLLDRGGDLDVVVRQDAPVEGTACTGLLVEDRASITSAMLAASRQLRVIGVLGDSLAKIDIEAATSQGIAVMHVPETDTAAAAEHTVGLMLALARNVPKADHSMKRGEWNRKAYAGSQLYGKVLGIVGFGRLGRAVADIGKGFGMRVVGYDPYAQEDALMAPLDQRADSLGQLLESADFVTIHIPDTETTRGMFDKKTMSGMKSGARLIDTSGGGAVDAQALVEVLQEGPLAGAALDWLPDCADLGAIDNLIMTPGMTGRSSETRSSAERKIANSLRNALTREQYENVVNTPFLSETDWGHVRPYADLAERMGLLGRQLVRGSLERVTVQIKGEIETPDPVCAAFLKGLLSTALGERVNLVNAAYCAKERGIRVDAIRTIKSRDFTNILLATIQSNQQKRELAGTLLGNKYLRVVKVDDYYLDLIPEGIILFLFNEDKPGVIAAVSGKLADAGINIAGWQLGRNRPGGDALAAVNLDSEPSPALLQALSHVEHVQDVLLVHLGRKHLHP